jgi:excisionase family DNA binding protein
MRVKNDNTDVSNAKEAAAFLKAHVETIRRLARRGEIPAFKVGRDWRFHQDAVRRWSEEQSLRT